MHVAVGLGQVAEQGRDVLDAAVEAVHLGVDLDPVAGRDHRRLGDVLGLGDGVRQLGRAVGVEREPLQHRDRCALVGDPHAQDAHGDPTTLATTSPRSIGLADGAGHRLALLVVGEDLQLDRQVDLAHVDALGHGDHGGGEVEDAGDTGSDQAVGDLLGHRGRGGDDGDRDAVLRDEVVEVVDVLYADPAVGLTDAGDVVVEQRGDPEAAGAEARVVGQRLAQVAEPDDDDRPVLGEPDLAGDLVAEVLHVVADAAGAVRAEVAEVLAQLRRVDPRGDRQLLAGRGGDAALGQHGQRPQIDRQPGDGGLGDAASAVVGRPGRRGVRGGRALVGNGVHGCSQSPCREGAAGNRAISL